MAKKLTERQREVLEFVVGYVSEKGFPPSVREIGAALKISSLRGVTIHLDALEKKGWINRERTSRGIQVLAPIPGRKSGAAAVPVLGTIAAGIPILAFENVESYVFVPEEMVEHSNKLFALRVRGDSMIGDAILPDDLVIVRSQRNFSPGDMVAALLGEEATVKRLKMDKDRVTLVASNPIYEPIVVDRDDSRIIGKVVGLIRNY